VETHPGSLCSPPLRGGDFVFIPLPGGVRGGIKQDFTKY